MSVKQLQMAAVARDEVAFLESSTELPPSQCCPSPTSACSLGPRPQGVLRSRWEQGCVGAPPVHPPLPRALVGTRDCFTATPGGRVQNTWPLLSSLSQVKVAGLLDEVPVDLRGSHIEVWRVDGLLNRKQFLLGHPHLVCFSFQFHLNATDRGGRSVTRGWPTQHHKQRGAGPSPTQKLPVHTWSHQASLKPQLSTLQLRPLKLEVTCADTISEQHEKGREVSVAEHLPSMSEALVPSPAP